MYGNAALKRSASKLLPPTVASFARAATAPARFRTQCRRGRRGHARHGSAYRQRLLFIAGLPKSGTSWLEQMVAAFPGFSAVLIPDVVDYERAAGHSHDYDLPSDMFDRLRGMLAVTKMHAHGSPHNVDVLRRARVPYVVLYRDLRDVAVSHYFYVRATSWHPEHGVYRALDVQEALAVFALRTLGDYVQWVRSWHENRDPRMSLELRYEDLLQAPEECLGQVARLFELDAGPDRIAEIVARHGFRRLSGGRAPGEERATSFVRKGVAGDWRNHFTPTLVDLYKPIVGDWLIRFGYEADDTWGVPSDPAALAAATDAPDVGPGRRVAASPAPAQAVLHGRQRPQRSAV